MRRIMQLARGGLVLFCLAGAAQAQDGAPGGSLVPPEQRISDREARRQLAEILSYDTRTLAQAQAEYELLLAGDPQDLKARIGLADVCLQRGDQARAETELKLVLASGSAPLEIRRKLARLLVWRGRLQEAQPLLQELLAELPDDPELAADLVDCEAAAGHARACRPLCERWVADPGTPWELRLRFAACMNLWGDFYAVERTYRQYLAEYPGDISIQDKLAEVLVAEQRFEEAETLYEQYLLERPGQTELWIWLARARFLEMDFRAAIATAEQALEQDPEYPEALELKAAAELRLGLWNEAAGSYEALAVHPECRVDAWVGLGKVCLRQGRDQEAADRFKQALEADPASVAARFHASGLDEVRKDTFVDKLVENESTDRLIQWAGLYGEWGWKPQAVRCWEAAWERNREYLPSWAGLAQMLAVAHEFDRADELYRGLIGAFPASFKFRLEEARLLAWGKKYFEALEAYEDLKELDPRNSVPRKEMARTAAWGKDMRESGNWYGTLWAHPVDWRLWRALTGLPENLRTERLQQALTNLQDQVEEDRVFRGYEEFAGRWKDLAPELPAETRQAVDRILLEQREAYRIQKAAWLEWETKLRAWNKRFLRALPVSREAVGFAPGNLEAQYDLAQVEFALGLDDRAVQSTRQLLVLDPFHDRAPVVLENMASEARVSLLADYAYWNERGRGGFVDIRRQHFDFGADIPLFHRAYVRLLLDQWREEPDILKETFQAQGFTLAAGGVATGWLRAHGSLTVKDYSDPAIPDPETGLAAVEANLRDLVTLGLQVERTDELYDSFGIRKGIQADAVQGSALSFLTRDLEVNGVLRHQSFSDNNAGDWVYLRGAYAVTEHPAIFKPGVFGEFRNTDKESQSVRGPGDLYVDVIHPYWTPKDYYAWGLILEWYHDRSRLFSQGTDLHYYDLKATLRDDTENNPTLEAEAGVHWEFRYRWFLGLKGKIVRSRQWDAEGLWATLQRHF